MKLLLIGISKHPSYEGPDARLEGGCRFTSCSLKNL